MHIFTKFILFTLLLINFSLVSSESDKYIYTSYQNSIHCAASAPILYPSTVSQLQDIIIKASESGRTVKVFGSRHSVTDVICTSGIPVSCQHLNYTYFPSPNSTNRVTVGGGAELRDVLEFLEQYDRSLVHMPTFGGITIAGAIGVGAHGSSLRHPTAISDQIVALTIIDGRGKLRFIRDPTELRAFRVSLGLLGAIVDVTLETVPLVKMKIHNHLHDEQILTDGTALSMARSTDWFLLFWFPFSQQVVVSEGNYTSPRLSARLAGNAETNFIPNFHSLQIEAYHTSLETAQARRDLAFQYALEEYTKHSLYVTQTVGKPPIFTEVDEDGNTHAVNPALGYAHRLMSNRCSNQCPWDNHGQNHSLFIEESEFAIPVDKLSEAVATIKEILHEIPAAFAMTGVMMRFHKKSEGLMSLAAERDSVTVEWATPMRDDPWETPRHRLGAYQAISQAMLQNFDGRPHWGKNGLEYFTRNVISRRPQHLLDQFRKTMKKYDPDGTFMNHFGRRVHLRSDVMTVAPRARHCALQDYCTCRSDQDCAEGMTCEHVMEKYTVCKERAMWMLPVVDIPPGFNYDPFNLTDVVKHFMPQNQFMQIQWKDDK